MLILLLLHNQCMRSRNPFAFEIITGSIQYQLSFSAPFLFFSHVVTWLVMGLKQMLVQWAQAHVVERALVMVNLQHCSNRQRPQLRNPQTPVVSATVPVFAPGCLLCSVVSFDQAGLVRRLHEISYIHCPMDRPDECSGEGG